MTDTGQNRETGTAFLPRFDENGLIGCMVLDWKSREPLMFAYANHDAVMRTLETGEAHFFSRSRQEIWHKGATSGNVLKVHDMLIDCDQDILCLLVEPRGHAAACHTGHRSCFYRRVTGTAQDPVLEKNGVERLFDPDDVYGRDL